MAKQEVVGGWVDLRDPKTVSERLRRPVITKASQLSSVINEMQGDDSGNSVSSKGLGEMFEFNDLLAVALISEWSFGSEVSTEALLDLPAETYDAIQKLVAPLVTDLMPSFEVTPEADSPTEPSGA